MKKIQKIFISFGSVITIGLVFGLLFYSNSNSNSNSNPQNECMVEEYLILNQSVCPLKTRECILQYKGIQYARANRFEKPVLTNITLGTCGLVYGNSNACYQGDDQTIYESECLYLDIYTKPSLQNAPVMIYSHGGGHVSGFNGWAFGEDVITNTEDVVYVNFQYRLGVFGITGTNELALSENNVVSPLIYDHHAVLQWIQQNIHLFGGDPHKVTLSGFSAGSINAVMMLSSPTICPLFSRAILYGFWNTRPRALTTTSRSEQEEIMKEYFGVENITQFILSAPAYEVWSVTNELGDIRPPPDDELVLHNHLSYSNPCDIPVIVDGSMTELALWETMFGIPAKADDVAYAILNDWNQTYGKEILQSVFVDYNTNFENSSHAENLNLANDVASLSNIYGALGINNVTNSSSVYTIMHSWTGKRGSHGHGSGVALLNNRAFFNIDNISTLLPIVHSYRKYIHEFMEYGIVKDWESVGDEYNPNIVEVSNSEIHMTNLQNMSHSMFTVLRKIKESE